MSLQRPVDLQATGRFGPGGGAGVDTLGVLLGG
jgi:hypothetical protein